MPSLSFPPGCLQSCDQTWIWTLINVCSEQPHSRLFKRRLAHGSCQSASFCISEYSNQNKIPQLHPFLPVSSLSWPHIYALYITGNHRKQSSHLSALHDHFFEIMLRAMLYVNVIKTLFAMYFLLKTSPHLLLSKFSYILT